MASSSALGTRRALVLYVGAVVGPTLVVLTLGVLAALRQVDALETLRITTRRLQEARIAEELERQVLAAADAALGDPALESFARIDGGVEPARLDELRRALPPFRARHPLVREVFVLQQGEFVYPRIHAPLLRSVERWVAAEPRAARGRIERALDEAMAHETARRPAAAARTYMRVLRAASTRPVQAFALAAAARSLTQAGAESQAQAAWRQLAGEYPDTYTPADRPHAVVAALELRRRGEEDFLVRSVARDLANGRWSVTPEQARYFLGELGVGIPGVVEDRFLGRLQTLGDDLGFAEPAPATGVTRLRGIGTGADTVAIAYLRRPDQPSRTVGLVLDADWIRATVLPRVAAGVAPGQTARMGVLEGDHAPLRDLLPGWRVAVEATPATSPWVRLDLVAFAAATVVVLGVLVMGVVLLMRDVSRETDLNRMRADLVSGVSHELKAPLSVIRVYAETIDEVPDASPRERHQFTAAIIQETDRLQRLVSDVVDFSRIQQGERPYHLATGSLTAVVASAAERSRRYADLHGFALETEVPAEAPAVRLDVSAVEQAVLNLVDNAFKYSGDSRRVGLRVRSQDGTALVEVQDWGPGIPLEQQPRIFERFHRGAHADRGGYGLGLYLVRHIMEAHGGQVEVESEPGRGSLFRLRFPIAREADAQGAAG